MTEPEIILRGLRKITAFLRVELDEPDLPVSRVSGWVRGGKLDVSRFGPKNITATPSQLRASLRGKAT
jgi:hypothetical protein